MVLDGCYEIDWERRRMRNLPGHGSRDHCLHGSRLIEWCGDCAADLDALCNELLP